MLPTSESVFTFFAGVSSDSDWSEIKPFLEFGESTDFSNFRFTAEVSVFKFELPLADPIEEEDVFFLFFFLFFFLPFVSG
jgi:uncharacterized membrane protein (UPF0182 family)